MSAARTRTAAGAALDAALATYQWLLRPILGPNCRFEPSCSTYAREAIALHGPRSGLALAARRVCRCHPWCEGGFDPVPPATASNLPGCPG